MKFLSALLISSMLISGSAFSSTVNSGLKSAIDELNYSLMVEWDQKDSAFYTEQVAIFKNKMLELRKDGADQATLIKEAANLIQDQKAKEELLSAYNQLDLNKMSEQEALAAIKEMAVASQKKGASWNGETALVWIPGIVIMALVVYIVATFATNGVESDGTYDPSANRPTYTCDYQDLCWSKFGPGFDDLGFPTGEAKCGYQYVCGSFRPNMFSL